MSTRSATELIGNTGSQNTSLSIDFSTIASKKPSSSKITPLPANPNPAIDTVFSASAPIGSVQTPSQVPLISQPVSSLIYIGPGSITLNMDAQPQNAAEVTLKEELRQFEQEMQWFTRMLSSESAMWMKLLKTKWDTINQCSFFTHRIDRLIVEYARTQNLDRSLDPLVSMLNPHLAVITRTTEKLHQSIAHLQEFLRSALQLDGQSEYLKFTPRFDLTHSHTLISRLINQAHEHLELVINNLNTLCQKIVLLPLICMAKFKECACSLKALLNDELIGQLGELLSRDLGHNYTTKMLTKDLDAAKPDEHILENLCYIANNQAQTVTSEISTLKSYFIKFREVLTHDLEQCRDRLQNAQHLICTNTSPVAPLLEISEPEVSIQDLFTTQSTNGQTFSTSTTSCNIHYALNDDSNFQVIYRSILDTLDDFMKKILKSLKHVDSRDAIRTSVSEMLKDKYLPIYRESSFQLIKQLVIENITIFDQQTTHYFTSLEDLLLISLPSLLINSETQVHLDEFIENVLEIKDNFEHQIDSLIGTLKKIQQMTARMNNLLKVLEKKNHLKKIAQSMILHLAFVDSHTTSYFNTLTLTKSALNQCISTTKLNLHFLLQLLKQRALFQNHEFPPVDCTEQSIESRPLIISPIIKKPTDEQVEIIRKNFSEIDFNTVNNTSRMLALLNSINKKLINHINDRKDWVTFRE